jgi:hypothetical protein
MERRDARRKGAHSGHELVEDKEIKFRTKFKTKTPNDELQTPDSDRGSRKWLRNAPALSA